MKKPILNYCQRESIRLKTTLGAFHELFLAVKHTQREFHKPIYKMFKYLKLLK